MAVYIIKLVDVKSGKEYGHPILCDGDLSANISISQSERWQSQLNQAIKHTEDKFGCKLTLKDIQVVTGMDSNQRCRRQTMWLTNISEETRIGIAFMVFILLLCLIWTFG